MYLTLDKKGTLYEQIARAVKLEILEGRILEGDLRLNGKTEGQLLEAGLERFQGRAVALLGVPELGREEDLVAGQPGGVRWRARRAYASA